MADWVSWLEETAGAIAEIADQVQTQTTESVDQWLSQSSQSVEKGLDELGDRLDIGFEEWWNQNLAPFEQAFDRTLNEWDTALQPWMAPFLNWHVDPQTLQEWEAAEHALDEVILELLDILGVELESGTDDLSDEALWDEIAPKTTPRDDWHPACIGCQNFHGRTYEGNLLVCAMHPYGVEGDRCPDWSDADPA